MRRYEQNSLLMRHGPAGSILFSVYRWAVAGWTLFALAVVLLAVITLAERWSPRPVLVVDSSGRVMGQVVWRKVQDDRALAGGARRFVEAYLSMNSETVFDDYGYALNLMSDALRRQAIQRIRATGYLAKIRDAHWWSWVEFTSSRSHLWLRRSSDGGLVHLAGHIVVIGEARRVEVPFDLIVDVRSVPRTDQDPYGVEIESVRVP